MVLLLKSTKKRLAFYRVVFFGTAVGDLTGKLFFHLFATLLRF